MQSDDLLVRKTKLSHILHKYLGYWMMWALGWLFGLASIGILNHVKSIMTFNDRSLPDISTSTLSMVGLSYLGIRPFTFFFGWILIVVGTMNSSYVKQRGAYPRIKTVLLSEIITLGIYIVADFIVNILWLSSTTPPLWTEENYAFVIHMLHIIVNFLQLLSLIRLQGALSSSYLYLYGQDNAAEIWRLMTTTTPPPPSQ